MVTGANRLLHRQSSQNPQSLTDTVGSHADQTTSKLTNKPLDPVNQSALAIEKLANKNPQQSLFHPKTTLTFNYKMRKMRNLNTSKTCSIQRFECSRIELRK